MPMPMTISGVTMGKYSEVSAAFLPKKSKRCNANAAIVPMIVAKKVEVSAITSVLRVASITSRLRSNWQYQ